jgi:iron complex outermembrane receptor protein
MGFSRTIFCATAALMLGGAAYGQQADAPQQAQAGQAGAANEEIVVFGRSQTRESHVVKQIEIQQAAPGTSPLKVLNKLPGVNFQSADPYGSYEWSARITLRGFNQIQLGFTLDDIPLGDMFYSNFNGLHISRAIISENISSAVVSEGAGALGTASSSNLGGTIQFYSDDPIDSLGGILAQGFGSDAARRTYVRLGSGLFATGTKFYVSYADQDTDKWKGAGEQRQKQANGKLVQEIGQDSRFSVFVNWSDRQEIDYVDMSKQMLSVLGYNWDNYYPNWQLALDAAHGKFIFDKSKIASPLDAATYAGSGLREDILTGGTLDAALTDDISAKVTGYHHSDDGRGTIYTPYFPSFTPDFSKILAPISTRATSYDIDRNGVLASVTGTFGNHKITGGLWYESIDFEQGRAFYADTIAAPLSPYEFPTNPFLTQFDYLFHTDTWQFYLQDTVTITDQLTASFGFKSLSVTNGSTTVAGPVQNGAITAAEHFLPQFGLTYAISNDQELFFNFTQNLRAFQGSVIGLSPFVVLDTQKFQTALRTLKPEESMNYEAGWRYRNEFLEAQATLYHIDFFNRLLAYLPCQINQSCPLAINNVGSVETNGAEAGVLVHPLANWSLLGSVSFNDSNYQNDYFAGSTLVPTKGKEVVDSPKWMFKGEIAYDDSNLYGSLGVDYFAKRYYTYVDDNYAGAYAIFNLMMGYRVEDPFAHVKELDFRVNVDNLFDRHYIATIGSNGFVPSDPQGTVQTLLPGAPRSAFFNVTAKF